MCVFHSQRSLFGVGVSRVHTIVSPLPFTQFYFIERRLQRFTSKKMQQNANNFAKKKRKETLFVTWRLSMRVHFCYCHCFGWRNCEFIFVPVNAEIYALLCQIYLCVFEVCIICRFANRKAKRKTKSGATNTQQHCLDTFCYFSVIHTRLKSQFEAMRFLCLCKFI